MIMHGAEISSCFKKFWSQYAPVCVCWGTLRREKIQIGVALLDTVTRATIVPVAWLFNTHFYEV